MSFYQKVAEIGKKYIGQDKLFKYAFNLSPMYRRSTGRIVHVSADLLHVALKLPISYKNRNYVGTMFGGSMASATDPIFMVQLSNILGNNYVVWDKATTILFKRPGKTTLYADFDFSEEEITDIKSRIDTEKEIVIVKKVFLLNKDKTSIVCEIDKTLYISDKNHYKQKMKLRNK